MENVIIAILTITIGIVALSYFIKEKNFANPITIFNSVWTVVFFFSMTNIHVIPGQLSTYFLFFLGIVFFDLGCIIRENLAKRKILVEKVRMDFFYGDYVLRNKIFYIFLILSIIYYFGKLLMVLNNVSGFSLENIMWSTDSEKSSIFDLRIMNALYTLIIHPFSFISPAIAAVDYLVGSRSKKLIIGTIFMLGLRIMSSGNRMSFLIIFIYIIFICDLLVTDSISSNNVTMKKKDKKKIKLMFLLSGISVVLLFIVTTMSRGYDVIQNVSINFAIPMRLFEIWAERVRELQIYGCGEASVQGFIYPFFYIIKNIFNIGIPKLIIQNFNIIEETVIQWVSAGHYMHNAYVSIFWYFFLDFRIIGVILFSFILGNYSFSVYKRVKKNCNCKVLTLYCVILHALLMSYGNFTFANVPTGIGTIMLIIVFYKKIKRIER